MFPICLLLNLREVNCFRWRPRTLFWRWSTAMGAACIPCWTSPSTFMASLKKSSWLFSTTSVRLLIQVTNYIPYWHIALCLSHTAWVNPCTCIANSLWLTHGCLDILLDQVSHIIIIYGLWHYACLMQFSGYWKFTCVNNGNPLSGMI